MLAFIFLILNYFYTLIAYQVIYELFDGYCTSTLECLFRCVDLSFKADGALGGSFVDDHPINITDAVNITAFRFVFDNSYNFIIAIIMVSIVSGIIIDQFGDDRSEEEAKQDDRDHKCFICGQDIEVLDKAMGTRNVKCHLKVNSYSFTIILLV